MGEGLAERFPLVGICYGLLYAVYCCPERRGGLTDAIFVDEGLGDGEAIVEGPDYRG